MDEEIHKFYSQNNILFQNNDKSKKMTLNGINFQKYVKQKYDEINIKNHIGDGVTKFNDMLLIFEGNCTPESCSISCIHNKQKKKIL